MEFTAYSCPSPSRIKESLSLTNCYHVAAGSGFSRQQPSKFPLSQCSPASSKADRVDNVWTHRHRLKRPIQIPSLHPGTCRADLMLDPRTPWRSENPVAT